VSAEAVFDQLDPVMTRWTMGGQATGLVPAAWKEALGNGDLGEGELRLLGLTGHYLSLCVAPTPATALIPLPDIPRLALPLLPAAHAPLARRCLKALADGAGQRDLIHLIAARGYTIHPADWMPSRHDDMVPDVYAPWRDWIDQQSGHAAPKQDTHDELTEANWSEWWPSARRIALARLRSEDPARATALLAAKAASEGAEARLRLIECLIPGLSESDALYLESLSTDRAPKIKALAASLLARLGRGTGAGDDATELAGFYDIQTKGLLRRTRILLPRPLKTPAQRSRRETLFAKVDFGGFANALGVSAGDLMAMWPLGNDMAADYEFATFAAQSAPEPCIDALSARLMTEAAIELPVVRAIKPRLGFEQCNALARRLLVVSGGSFTAAHLIAGAGAELDSLIDTPPGKKLTGEARGDADITYELRALALIASPVAARAAMDRFIGAGLSPSDPRLDLLRLNAALLHSGVHQ
jgi:Family of unknown function (DUF5691)